MMARPPGSHRSKAVIQEAVKRYMSDELVETIASDVGVTQPTISYWMRRYGKDMGGTGFKRRSRGRRLAEVPTGRDQDIISLRDCGVPIRFIGKMFGLARQRVNFIVKTWAERGYVPVPKFEVGDMIYVETKDRVTACRVYKLTKVCPDRKAATALLVRSKVLGKWVDAKTQVLDKVTFFKDGKLVELLSRDRQASQNASVEEAEAV